jgi:alpha-1,3-fucosyltransferase
VLFQAPRLDYHPPPKPLRPDHVWICVGLESPVHYRGQHGSPDWRGVFNWTMTYRRDSDIYAPYEIVKPHYSLHRNFTAIFAAKSKMAAWMVTNCHTSSRRENYARRMANIIPLDIIGSCGRRGANIGANRTMGIALLNNTYKFYLSFENSLCVDYVTEKMMKTIPLNVVPVVRGGANYTAMFPNGTYINADDFVSPEALAGYLSYLNKHPEKYIEYLKRKFDYRIHLNGDMDAMCKICEMLHNIGKHRRVYNDVTKWLVGEHGEMCHSPSSQNM